MEKGVKMQITLTPELARKLDQYCKKSGLKRSAVVAIALNKLWEGEEFDVK